MKILIGIENKDKEVIVSEVNVADYLKSEFQVADIPSIIYTGRELSVRKPSFLSEKTKYINRIDYFFKFKQLEKIQQIKLGFSLLQTKLDPMICGSGHIEEINQITYKSKCISSIHRISDTDQFWKL